MAVGIPKRLFVATLLLAMIGSGIWLAFVHRWLPEAESLRPYVHGNPPVAVVFTSRTDASALIAPAPDAEGFHYPGTIPWAAHEGRLRLLKTDGRVYELTWNRPLPDGSYLIDVMSPSVTLDGRAVLFAGRKAPPDPGRWRLYRVNIDGSDLEPLTGGSDDTGCIARPPLRYASDGSLLPAEIRDRLDYDDVDPTDCGPNGIAFVSSRLPDLGRGHSRRATQIWLWRPGATAPSALTSNRNNDRWPYLAGVDNILFSLWSRNREAVTPEGEVAPVSNGGKYLTRPTDIWMAARVQPDGSQFGYAVKADVPVWRPRPLFNGRIVFMSESDGRLRVVQADWGYLRAAPSSLAVESTMPIQGGQGLDWGPRVDATGRELVSACPSPCPEHGVVFSAAPLDTPLAHALYLVDDHWGTPTFPRMIFDDPELVDSEPVAAYPRDTQRPIAEPTPAGNPGPEQITLLSGRIHPRSFGFLENGSINEWLPHQPPGQTTDTGRSPVIPHPTGIKAVAFYGAHRDRFDDPERPRVRGEWEKLKVAPLDADGALRTWIPADPLMPTVLAGLGSDGKVFHWDSSATDSKDHSASFYAIAGDHYSGTRTNGYHFCVGCHTGHTFINVDVREQVKE